MAGIDPQRFLIVAEADRHASGHAVRIAEIVEHPRVAAVRDIREHEDRLVITPGKREVAASAVDVLEIALLRIDALLLVLVPDLAAGALLTAASAAASAGSHCRCRGERQRQKQGRAGQGQFHAHGILL